MAQNNGNGSNGNGHKDTIRPTKLQRALAALLVSEPGISLRQAMLRVGYSKAMAVNHVTEATRDSPGYQAALSDELARGGVSNEIVVSRLREALDYKKVQRIKTGSAINGSETVEEFIDVDNSGRLAAVEVAARLKGWLKDGRDPKEVYVMVIAQLVPIIAPFVPEENRLRLMAMLESGSASSP